MASKATERPEPGAIYAQRTRNCRAPNPATLAIFFFYLKLFLWFLQRSPFLKIKKQRVAKGWHLQWCPCFMLAHSRGSSCCVSHVCAYFSLWPFSLVQYAPVDFLVFLSPPHSPNTPPNKRLTRPVTQIQSRASKKHATFQISHPPIVPWEGCSSHHALISRLISNHTLESRTLILGLVSSRFEPNVEALRCGGTARKCHGLTGNGTHTTYFSAARGAFSLASSPRKGTLGMRR